MERPRLIEIESYGSNGWKPTRNDCKRCLHGGEVSCVSGSGDSLCGGYGGQVNVLDRELVLCHEDTPARPASYVLGMPAELKDLQIGVRYRIKFEDCCVSGEMTGTFLGWNEELSDEDDRLTYHRAKFDFGEIEGWAWNVEVA
jgi:hypothetical protein